MSFLHQNDALQLLFNHPEEYVFIPRGPFVMDIPKSFFPPRLIDKADLITDRLDLLNSNKIPVMDIQEPSLVFAANYGRKSPFSLFNPKDREVSSELITLLMNAQSVEEFIALAAYIRDRINPFLFQYALSVAVQHRKDTNFAQLPSVVTQFPGNFIEPGTLKDAKEEVKFMPPKEKIAFEVPVNNTASNREEEQRMAYFREDIGVNMHHWHWHLVYPNSGPIEVVNKDRRGELFMYMHNQIIARYNLDRFCNDLGKTTPLGNLREPIPEGYYPKLLETVSSRSYPPRLPGQKLHDMNRPDLVVSISDLERSIDRVLGSIERGFVFDPNGIKYPLDEKNGIDLLGNIIESSSLSINPEFYGNVHNLGHLIISSIHDPDWKFSESYSVMGDTTTAMRDPIFYRWHTFIDSLGLRHKALLPPYGPTELGFNAIFIESIVALGMPAESQKNVIKTSWEKSDVDIGLNLDLNGRPTDGMATFRFTHLMHEPFNYRIVVHNKSGARMKSTCRIFLLPKNDNRTNELTLEEQRLLAVEMDRFSVILQPGVSTITRSSEESSVTIPFTKIFKPENIASKSEKCYEESCSCGWPSHMLLPKGTVEGKMFTLFVMISNDTNDVLLQNPFLGLAVSKTLVKSFSFCGLKNEKYPDQRSMGFPFDRKLPDMYLKGLIQQFGNMNTCELKIVFQGNDENNVKTEKVKPENLLPSETPLL